MKRDTVGLFISLPDPLSTSPRLTLYRYEGSDTEVLVYIPCGRYSDLAWTVRQLTPYITRELRAKLDQMS